ncbi:MAG: biotin--[acetyl-CoA-carboxylase] ligase [Pirellulaceae bacterium]|nr:MAG: biotin--[acetyl-CoA-carboxylase] ligase [Pirellulaceae bacterium]
MENEPLGIDWRAREAARHEILSAGWIRSCQWVEEIDSTSSWLQRQLRADPGTPLPALRVADRQTAGRGRGNKRWFSPHGCLMCTFAIGPSELLADARRLGTLALISGLAVASVASCWVDPAQVQLKWPNDLYVAGRKCGGILIESVFAPAEQRRHTGLSPDRGPLAWLIGIGLNVAIDWTTAPQEIRTSATCLRSHAHAPLEVGQVLLELVDRLHATLKAWRDDTLDWRVLWRRHCMLTGRCITARTAAGKQLEGTCLGIDELGCLLLQGTNQLHRLQSAEIVHW